MAGGDRIVEVDPRTGALVRIIGPTGIDDVLGLGYWGGIAYGFTLAGTLIQIDLTSGAGTVIPIPDAAAPVVSRRRDDDDRADHRRVRPTGRARRSRG